METIQKIPSFQSLVEIIENDPKNAEVLITPLEKNFGTTLGNLLRRTILGMTPGCAITSIVTTNNSDINEFSHLTGMKENMDEFIHNLKLVQISMSNYGPRFLSLQKNGPSIVRVEDIIAPDDIIISNPNQYLCSLNEDTSLDFKIKVESGIGFRPSSSDSGNEIKIHAVFSPVTHVCYHIKHFTFYEELVLHVQTDGSIEPIEVINDTFNLLLRKFKQNIATS